MTFNTLTQLKYNFSKFVYRIQIVLETKYEFKIKKKIEIFIMYTCMCCNLKKILGIFLVVLQVKRFSIFWAAFYKGT